MIWAKLLAFFATKSGILLKLLGSFKIYILISILTFSVGFLGGYKLKGFFHSLAEKEKIEKGFEAEKKLIEKDKETEIILKEEIKEVKEYAKTHDPVECFNDDTLRMFND